MRFKVRAYRSIHKQGEMNNVERDYAAHLELLKKAGEILDYCFECETLKLGKDCRYTPDFRVLRPENEFSEALDEYQLTRAPFVEFHEVKGTKRKKNSLQTSAFVEDDALVKIKTAATIHHMYKFIMVWKGLNGQWERKEIN